MAIYVLVHGGNMSAATWNLLTVGEPVHTKDGFLGARYWDGTVAALRNQNHKVFAPTLADEHGCHLTDHVDQISALIIDNDLREVILVGHSYGGMVITGVAARIPERIRRLVYLDAALPDPGQSLFDLIESGGRDPLSFTGLEPASPYIEKLQFDPGKIKRLQKTYIFCAKSEFAVVTRIAKQKIDADREGWTYLEMPSSHVPMADMPEEFYEVMLDIAKE